MKKLPIYLVVSLFAIVVSCSKKSSGPTKAELLVSASWVFNCTGLDVNKDGFVDTNLPAGYLNNCDLDNSLTFNADGTISLKGSPMSKLYYFQDGYLSWSSGEYNQNIVYIKKLENS